VWGRLALHCFAFFFGKIFTVTSYGKVFAAKFL